MKPKLLIVDDDEDIRTQMKWALTEEYDVILAEDRPKAVGTLESEKPDLVLLDLGLPPSPNDTDEGFAALAEMLALRPAPKVVVITGQGEKENALRAIGEGAYDFLNKPIDTDELKIILKRAHHVARLEQEYREMQDRLKGESFEDMLGASPEIQKVFAGIRKVATTDVPVLVLGESGTGKELVAMAVHRRSPRKEGPFIAINCSAIPETLLESELFGHEKGAFTGAHIQRKGRIESANGGTLFLDEIGDLPPSLQVKLLRFLQEKCIERVGGRGEIKVDTRVIAATNTNLKEAMKEARFREDLYFRLAVVSLQLPPLRDRTGDIPLIAKVLLKRHAEENGVKLTGFTPQAMRAMESYEWTGNIREMENRIKRAIIMAEGKKVTAADLELDSRESGYQGMSLKQAREALEKELVERALARHKGTISRAAEELGISRPTLYELMEKLGIKKG